MKLTVIVMGGFKKTMETTFTVTHTTNGATVHVQDNHMNELGTIDLSADECRLLGKALSDDSADDAGEDA
jgi:hypothetical protein